MDFETYLKQIRDFSQNVLIPAEETVEAEERIPDALVQQMRELGLFGISIPEEYGGLAWGQEEQVRLTFEFTQASAVYRSRFSTTIGLCSQALLDYGTKEQKEKWLPKMASGETTAAFCLTEEMAGSDAANVQTTAVLDGSEYVINGSKRYITNAPDADLFLVMAKTDPADPTARGMSALLVERGTPGVTVGPVPKMLGQRGSTIAEIYFEDCRTDVSNLVGGQEGGGLKAALRGINHARTHVAATCVGQAMRLIDEATAYAKERQQFGQAIGTFQSVGNMLADSQAEILAAKSLVLDVARKFDQGPPLPFAEIACAKYFSSEMVSRVADRAVQIFGGAGFLETSAVARLYRDTRLFRIFEGTSQIQQQNIAKAMLKS